MDNDNTILGGIDPEVMDRLVTRRDAIRQGASVSGKLAAGLALASVPVAIATLSKDAFAQTPSDVTAVLNFALMLEIFEIRSSLSLYFFAFRFPADHLAQSIATRAAFGSSSPR